MIVFYFTQKASSLRHGVKTVRVFDLQNPIYVFFQLYTNILMF